MTTATEVGNTLLVLAAIPAVASALIYGFGVTWWRSWWGRHLSAYMASFALVLSLGCLKLIIGDSPTFARIRVGAFATTVVALWWRLWVVVQAYREGPPEDGSTGGHP